MSNRLLIGLCLSALAGCSAGPGDDAGTNDSGFDAGPGDAGATDAGPLDAGAGDAGSDAGAMDAGLDGGGLDAGCGVADRLTITSAPQLIAAGVCSPPVRVQLSNSCGLPVAAGQAISLTLSASSASTEFFGDGSCIGKPNVFQIPAGATFLDLFFNEPAPTPTTLTIAAPGLLSAMQAETTACEANQKACNGTSCIPTGDCCNDGDCTAPKVCTLGTCKVPKCSGVTGGCFSFMDYSASGAMRTITFNSSAYMPACMKISNGQSVTSSGSFIAYPLQQTCGPADVNLSGGSGSNRTFTFNSFGTYGFRSTNGVGLKGAIQVQ